MFCGLTKHLSDTVFYFSSRTVRICFSKCDLTNIYAVFSYNCLYIMIWFWMTLYVVIQQLFTFEIFKYNGFPYSSWIFLVRSPVLCMMQMKGFAPHDLAVSAACRQRSDSRSIFGRFLPFRPDFYIIITYLKRKRTPKKTSMRHSLFVSLRFYFCIKAFDFTYI